MNELGTAPTHATPLVQHDPTPRESIDQLSIPGLKPNDSLSSRAAKTVVSDQYNTVQNDHSTQTLEI